MRLDLGSGVGCRDGRFGKLVDVVIDPTAGRVTHLVVEPDQAQRQTRLVPAELVERRDDASSAVLLRSTVDEVRRLPPVHELAFLRLGDFPLDDPDWDVGIQEVFALPYYPAYGIEPVPLDFSVTYDRVPKGEVEIRRASSVTSSDSHYLGHVDGFVVDGTDHITHLVLDRGQLCDRREVAIPVGAVARVETDAVTLRLTTAEVEALPPVAVHRWPRTIEHGLPRR